MDTIIEINWGGSGNLFWNVMTGSIVGCVRVSYSYLNILFAKKGEGAMQLLMYNDYLARHNRLEAATGLKGSDLIVKEGFVGVAVDNFELISEKLHHFQDETVIAGYGTHSLIFKLIWGHNLNRFYRGARTSKETAFLSTAVTMDGYVLLTALAAEVRAFHDNELVGSVHDVQVEMADVATAGSAVHTAQMDCARGMDKGLGWAKVLFADEPIAADRVRKINSCFPLALIMTHTNLEHLGLVNGGTFHQVILHGFKPGEKVYIEVDGLEDLLFWLMPDSKHPCPPTAFRVVKGTHIESLATVLGDLTNRHLMVTATSIDSPSHYILRTIPPPSV